MANFKRVAAQKWSPAFTVTSSRLFHRAPPTRARSTLSLPHKLRDVEAIRRSEKGVSHGRRPVNPDSSSARGLRLLSFQSESGPQEGRAEVVLISSMNSLEVEGSSEMHSLNMSPSGSAVARCSGQPCQSVRQPEHRDRQTLLRPGEYSEGDQSPVDRQPSFDATGGRDRLSCILSHSRPVKPEGVAGPR